MVAITQIIISWSFSVASGILDLFQSQIKYSLETRNSIFIIACTLIHINHSSIDFIKKNSVNIGFKECKIVEKSMYLLRLLISEAFSFTRLKWMHLLFMVASCVVSKRLMNKFHPTHIIKQRVAWMHMTKFIFWQNLCYGGTVVKSCVWCVLRCCHSSGAGLLVTGDRELGTTGATQPPLLDTDSSAVTHRHLYVDTG